MITDAHAHFSFKQFDRDLDEVVKCMKKDRVWRVVNNGVNLEDNKKVLALSEKYDIFLSALGLYPTNIVEYSDAEIKKTLKFIESNKDNIVAVGEVGLDHYHCKNPKDWKKQEKYFREIIKLANKIKKPLIVHSRKAEADIWEPLKEAKVPVVMHCFSGPAQELKIGLERKYYFTIPCSLARNKNQRKVAKRVSLNRLLTETDAPYLSPKSRARNTSSNIRFTVKEIAKLKSESEEKVSKAVLENFKRLFGSC